MTLIRSFNKHRSPFPCTPDCPERVPGCHDHCKRYMEARAKYDARKAEYEPDSETKAYYTEMKLKAIDSAAKRRKRSAYYHRNNN